MILFRKLLLQLTMILMAAALPFGLLQAQSSANSPYVPNIIPPSPNAAALMKFSDVPVSPYTGTADITVPIYTVQARGITVPVSVSYHTAGVKLEEEASWVGLGWAMNAGGMISRTIMGTDDFGSQGIYYFTNLVPQLAGDLSATQPPQWKNYPPISPYFFDFFCSYLVTTSAGTEDFTPAFGAGGNSYDMEPDIFSYNFPGHSGKFILTRAGNVVMQKQENIKIQFQGTTSAVTFTVTDEQGNIFYFNVQEQSSVSGGHNQTSSWLLSKIVTQQQDSVLFNYVSGGATASYVGDTYQTFYRYCTDVNGLNTTTGVAPQYYNQTLQSIDFSNGHIQFAADANRSDLSGAYKLDSVMVYSKNAAGVQTYLKQDNFYYSYFNSTTNQTPAVEYYRLRLDSVKEKSGSFNVPPYSFMYNNPNPGYGTAKHGFAVDHWGYYNGQTGNSGFIPSVTVLSSPAELNNPYGPQILNYDSAANREPDLASMETFSLQQITYPTGGKTLLAYQPNDYDWTNSIAASDSGALDPFIFVKVNNTQSPPIAITSHGTDSGTLGLSNIFPIIIPPNPNVTINVSFRYLKTYTNGQFPYTGSSGQITFSFGGATLDISNASCSGNICTMQATTIVHPNDPPYTWTAHIASSIDTVNIFAGIYANVQYQETQQALNQAQNNYVMAASGLRISSLTNYTGAGTIASEKVYSYTYSQDKLESGTPQQYSYGRLMSMPVYGRYAVTSVVDSFCTALSLFGSSISSLTSVIQGNIVGYDQVTEYNVDPLSGQDIGKTVYTYFNSPDTPIAYHGYRLPGTLNMGNSLSGLLLSKVDYTDNGGLYIPVAETDNFYHSTNRSVYFSPKYQYLIGGGSGMSCSSGTAVETQTLAAFYPSIKSERVLLDSTRHIAYQQGDATKFVASTQADYYDNPIHYQLTRSRIIDSKGDTLITLLKYPQDYIPSGNTATHNTILDSMIGRNMVSKTIEKRDSLYYPGSSAGYITGAELSLYRVLAGNNNTVVPDRSYKLGIQSPITNFTPFSISANTTNLDSRNRQMVSFDQYDGNNNLQQYTTTDQNPVSIIWDYVNRYPIAQVKNAVITDVAATSFEADGYGNWSPFTGTVTTVTIAPFPPTGNKYYNLTTSATLSKSGLVSGNTYIVSYWSLNGAYSISGGTGTSISGKTISGWTYYEHTVTASSTTLTISGTGSIDEVRLYPSTAQMTTYTYSPLTGMTTQCDVDNRVTYYFYDGLSRLMYVKDQDGNITKTYQYHYLNSTTQY